MDQVICNESHPNKPISCSKTLEEHKSSDWHKAENNVPSPYSAKWIILWK